MGSLCKQVQHFPDAQGIRVSEVKALAVQAALVADMDQRLGNKIHWHNINATTFYAQGGHPRRQGLAHLLDQFEKVVRPVNLVDFTGF